MASGQSVTDPVQVLDRMLAVERALECDELDRGALHARMLRHVLELNALYATSRMPNEAPAQIALSMTASEARAHRLLSEALALAELPGALDALEAGLLTVEQSQTVVTQLAVLELPGRATVWRQLQQQLISDADRGIVRPPARLAERLRRWVVAYDKVAAEQRRRGAEQSRRIAYRKQATGLADLLAFGFRPAELQTILQRIDALSAAFGSEDDRTADQRRFDALRDLLMGRYNCGQGSCGCRPGELAPCGAQLQVLVPIGAALGTTDEVAELIGHGPIEPDLLQALLLNAPALRAVFVDDEGVPVATSDTVVRPARNDPAAVRQALLDLTDQTPPEERFPRHPHDHSSSRCRGGSLRRPQLAQPLGSSHPPGKPGPYQVRGRLRRLVFLRAPRCEFPGCGARAARCDAEHDRAHPDGPTCACNLGPLCRYHHQVKQQGWTKTRGQGSAVTWTSRTGRSRTSPSQHDPPATPTRPPPPIPGPHPFDELSPWQIDEELWELGLLPDDPDAFDLRAVDVDAEDVDPDSVDLWGQPPDTTWTLDLHDPYLWADPAR